MSREIFEIVEVGDTSLTGWKVSPTGKWVFGGLVAASTAASVYHGYKRNRSVGWALAWGVAGTLFPVVTPAIAVAQGFGRRA